MSIVIKDKDATRRIAKNLVATLARKGMTQADLAEKTGESAVRIHYYATAKRLASAAALARIAEALEVRMDDLVQ